MTFKQTIVIAALALAGCLMGCGGEDSLKLTLPDGNIIEDSSIRVIASIKEQGNPPADGEEVTFSTTVGSFEEYSATVTAAVKSKAVEILGGKAEATMYGFPGEAGTGQVSASYVTINGVTVSDSVSITIEGGGRPAGGMLSASCDPQNVSVYADNSERSAMQIRCVVRVKDIRGRPVPSARISSLVESGCGLTPIPDEETTDHIFSLTPSCDPIDVEPMTGEPSHLEMSVIHNPRDGLLTMVFYTDGMEGFVDANGDGKYNQGESFAGFDMEEPYVDINDNNEYDAGEQFIDLDENGEWSPANGGWDEETKIWTSTKIMFTGRPHESVETTRFEPSGISIDNADSQKLTLYLMDINHNPIAAHEETDMIEFTAEGAQLPVDSVTLKKVMGVEFTPDGAIVASSFDENRDYEVTLDDQDPDPQSVPEAVTLSTTVYWTPAPYFDNYDATQQTEELVNVTGTSH
jgi:hypothetical protein